jgi:molybdate transport system ATP-binding protein
MDPFISLHIKLKRNVFQLNINNEIPSGIVCIDVPSGHGKTSLLNSIAGIVSPDEGRIYIRGEAVFDCEKKINIPVKSRNLGYVFMKIVYSLTFQFLKNRYPDAVSLPQTL